ncbi:M15 family metallopeptidase [Bacillus tuaregi]|uniref:M15 family metallopeptidase n=1 Tax=Bacillus tuaregi TaxID=1816695 RepID=UPI0008F904FD|nr:M15 family metallopeptidase [Bacillus tuaregi]
MKKIAITLGSIILLAGCNGNPFTEKGDVKQDEQASTQNQKEIDGIENDAGENKQNNNDVSNPESTKEDLVLESVFFNEIADVNGKKVIQNPTNRMVLVNKEYALPDGYEPEDLVRPNVAFSFGDQDIEKSYLRKEAAEALEKMFTEGTSNGVHLFAVSGYRSYDRQQQVFTAEVGRVGEELAVQAVAVPGYSEHQTGLSMDISSESASFGLTEQFGETTEGRWLQENAHRFGFILRYPSGKESITGYQYESWHYRYVGVEAATEIFENNLTLEEYFNIVKKI